MRAVLVDGVLQADGRVSLDADDPTLTLGLGVFETLRTYGRRPWHLDRHLLRLRASAQALGVPAHPWERLPEEAAAAIAGVPEGECNLRISLTMGGTRIVRAEPLVLPRGPARVRTWVSEMPPWLPGAVKHTSRAAWHRALPALGVDEVLRVDGQGRLLEGTRSNIFVVQHGCLMTPPADGQILDGVTRGVLIEVAQELGIPVAEVPIPRDGEFDEIYLASTLRELMGIVELDGQPAPGEGPVGRAVLAGFQARTVGGRTTD